MLPKKTKADPGRDAHKSLYAEALDRIERLDHRLHDVVRIEFERMGWHDINAVQALIIYRIGPGTELLHKEIVQRGYYTGSNASYNLKFLTGNGYLWAVTPGDDKRKTLLRLTPKGEEVAEVVGEMFDRHTKSLDIGGLHAGRLEDLNAALGKLERFWHDAAAYKL